MRWNRRAAIASPRKARSGARVLSRRAHDAAPARSEEPTSELQSLTNLLCRPLLCQLSRSHRPPPSFPTRRSSDLFQTRNRGTLGGSVAHADPSAEIPLALVVCGGTVVLQSRRRERRVPAREFFLGALTTQRR